MSNSILKEVTFTPQAFEKEFNLSNRKRFGKLISILEDLIDSGIIIAASNQWMDKVLNFIEKYEGADKDDIESIVKEIDVRGKIVSYPSNKTYNNENEWIKIISNLNTKRPFDFIAGTCNTDIVKHIELIDKKNYKNRGAIVAKQTESFIEKMLAPILAYADIVKVFDPYFKLTEERFEKVLKIICKNLCSRHGTKSQAIIEIHTSIKSMMRDKKFDWKITNSMPKIIKQFEQQYNHTITIKIWEEAKKEDEWHERWIITNQCGIFIGKGSDISNWTDSTWGLLDWEEKPEIESKFNPNRSKYNFIGEINSTSAIKNQNPKNTLIFMTNTEEAEEKKLQEKRIKNKLEEAKKSRAEKKKKTYNKATKKWE